MSKKIKNPNTYTGKELAGFLIGLAGQNIIYNIVSSGLTYYLQTVIFIPVMYTGVIFAIARVWDAINDPMMGTFVDKTHTKWGKCKPFLLFVPAVIMIITILTFVNGQYSADLPGWRKVLIVGWAGFSYILWGMSYTVGDIPLWGVTSLMTEDQNDRAKALSLARIVASAGFIGMLVQFAAPSVKNVFIAKGYDDATALQYGCILTAVVLTVFASILFQIAGLSVKERVKATTKETHTMKENFRMMWKCRPFRQLLISGILRSPIQLLSTIPLLLITYYYFNNQDIPTQLMGDSGINVKMIIRIVILAIGVFGGMMIGMAFTPGLARKFEKKKLYNFYSIIGAIPFLLVFVLYKVSGGDLFPMHFAVILGIVFFFASWAQGGLNVMQSIMIADCVDYEEYNNGIRPDGVFFSGQSFITKLSAGIATLISSAVYAIVGFSGDNIKVMNEELSAGIATFRAYEGGRYAMAMFLLVSIPPAIGMVLSAVPTWKYALTDKEHTEMLDALNERRAEIEE
ncbi:MAG: MFS transporter [Clostridia bacterium]|nr:MFS transporter [Clostridia bacterium]